MWNGETYDFTSRRWVIDEAWDFRAHYCLDIQLVNLGVWLNVKKYCRVWHRLTYGWKDVKSNKTFVWLTQRCERWRLTRIQTMRQTHEHPAKKAETGHIQQCLRSVLIPVFDMFFVWLLCDGSRFKRSGSPRNMWTMKISILLSSWVHNACSLM